MLTDEKISPRKALGILNIRHLLAIVLSIVLALGAVGYIGRMPYQSTQAELELRGEMNVLQSTDRFNAYLIVDKNVLIVAGIAVNQMLVSGASNQKILAYLTEQTESLMNTIAKSFTGLYGWINGEYLDGAGWTPDDDYVATERPWYQTAAAHPHEIVFVDPYVDMQTGNMMMTIAELLDDGESVIALDIGLEGVQEITDDIAKDTPGAVVMVLDNGNTAIAHSNIDEVGKSYFGADDSLESLIVRELHNGQDRFTVSFSGQSYMVFTKQIEGGWHSVSAIDTDLFYRPLIRVILFTLVLSVLAVALILVIFYRISVRELSNRNLGIQIRAAADIYDNLLDINLVENSFFELNNHKNPESIGRQHTKAQETLNERVEVWVEESMKPHLRDFLNFSTINQRLEEKSTITVEFLDKENIWYRGRLICAERKADGSVTRVLWGKESIDDEKRQKEYLQHLAETDLMTGVYNRINGEYRITELLNSENGGMFVLFDIDHFKLFNDRYSHSVGDQVIIAVANCLKNAFRGNDIIARLGGDEFAVFAPGVYAREVGESILNRFYDHLNNIALEKPVDEKICVSAGAVFDRRGKMPSFTQLYEIADQCMYESKKIPGSHVTYREC